MLEKKECEHTNCREEFPIYREKKYCSRDCKTKANKMRRYYNDDDYNSKQNDAAIQSYQKNKKVSYKRPSELTEAELEHLKTIKPEWFIEQN